MNERFVQDTIARFPEIFKKLLENQTNKKIEDIVLFNYEEILKVGRIDLVYRDVASKLLFAVELQINKSDDDHFDRLKNYVIELKNRYQRFEVYGILMCPSFSYSIKNKLNSEGLYAVQFSFEYIEDQLEEYERKEEQDFGIDLEIPKVHGFAKLSYFNKFLKFVFEKGIVTKEEIILNSSSISKSGKLSKTSNRPRDWINYTSKFDLLGQNSEGKFSLTNIGIEYVRNSNPDNIWDITFNQKRILISSLLTTPFSSGIKFGVYCALKTQDVISEGKKSKDFAAETFAQLSRKSLAWNMTSKKDALKWYSNYCINMGLIERGGKSSYAITNVGKRVLNLLDQYLNIYRMSRLVIFETTKYYLYD